MEDVRLYTLGELQEDLHDHVLEEWFKRFANGSTRRSAWERKVAWVTTQLHYTHSDVAWVSVVVKGTTGAHDWDRTFRVLRRPNEMWEIDPRCLI